MGRRGKRRVKKVKVEDKKIEFQVVASIHLTV
jgi:hypothetical protein